MLMCPCMETQHMPGLLCSLSAQVNWKVMQAWRHIILRQLAFL